MALTAYLITLFSLCRCVSSAPFDTASNSTTPEAPVLVTQIITSNVEVIETSTVVLQTSQQISTPLPSNSSVPIAPPPPQVLPTVPPSPQLVTNVVTVIATSTPPPITITVSAPPATVTQTITTSSSAVPTSNSSGPSTAWTAPAQMTDLASFKISYFPYGQHNVAIVNGTQQQPPQVANIASGVDAALADLGLAGTAGVASSSAQTQEVPPLVNGTNAALQLFYPAGSINPESQPQGGADFYASPIDISKANNVTLEYSVFFPQDFDWVLAGKLPGLYGGHSGCSGGNDARSCFSTRLMWRANGAGELYLYAPKDKQTAALCSAPPLSVCDQEYGLSIGRGAFNFTPGAWTHIRQTVTLNTPGGQDGGFALEVNGQEVMRRADVFYRDVTTASEPSNDSEGNQDDEDEPEGSDDGSGDDGDDGDDGGDGGDDGDNTDDGDNSPAPAKPSPSPPPPPPPKSSPQPAPLLDPGAVPILGPLLNGLRFRVMGSPHYVDLALGEDISHFLTLQARDDSIPLMLGGANASAFILPPMTLNDTLTNASSVIATATTTQVVVAEAMTQTMSVQAITTAVVYVDASLSSPDGAFVAESQTAKDVGFSGLFFSSFFGGHEEKYASPRDQYTWFKDFAITINDS